MTYTILARCPEQGSYGVGIATYSLAVGGYCPHVISHTGVLSSQANVDPRLGRLGSHLLREGFPAHKVLQELASSDEHFTYRQVGVIDRDGDVAVHTGPNTLPWHGHLAGDGYVAMGNGLAGEATVEAMAQTFEAGRGKLLEDRLLETLVAARDAGGQRSGMPARSSALIVHEREAYALMDLRVDFSEEAVEQLHTVHRAYRPYVPLYYELRVKHPHTTPPQEIWITQQSDGGPGTAAGPDGQTRARGS